MVKAATRKTPTTSAEKRKTVLLIGNFLSGSTGGRGVCEDLAEQLRAMGRSVITSSRKKMRAARLIDMLSTVWFKRSRYSVAQVDVYSGPAFFWAEAVCWMLRAIGKPHILTLHGGNLPRFAERWPGRVRRLLRGASAVTTPSRYLLEKMLLYRTDMTLIPNPLDIGAYMFRLRQRAQPKLVWLRAFHSIYNPSLAPRVLAELVKNFDDISLVMVGPDKGDGSLREVRKIASKLGVGTRISFPGRVAKSDVPVWMDMGDIFLNTTNVDNTPVSVIEAMACGMCVVSTNVGGIPYLLEHEKDALLVPPNDPEAMAEAIRRILTDPVLAERLSANARRKAEQHDWAVILPQWESLLSDVSKNIMVV